MDLEERLKQSVVNELENNKKSIDDKLNIIIKENKSYADSLKESVKIKEVPPSECEIANVIKSTKNDELIQEKERERRSANMIIYGISEMFENHTSLKEHDKHFVTSFLETIGVASNPKEIVRLGKENNKKKRPVKVIMNTSEEKDRIMSRLNNLKNADEIYRSLSVRDDYTIEERNLIRQYVNKAEQKNKAENTKDWKVRGNPKNGLRLVRITKRR